MSVIEFDNPLLKSADSGKQPCCGAFKPKHKPDCKEYNDNFNKTIDLLKNPFADIDPEVMGPQRHQLPQVKRRGPGRQLISPTDRARKGSAPPSADDNAAVIGLLKSGPKLPQEIAKTLGWSHEKAYGVLQGLRDTGIAGMNKMRYNLKLPAVQAAPRAKDPNAGKALKVVWDVRKPDGEVETREAILCPEHKDWIFSRHPNARGTGEYFPAEKCQHESHQEHPGAVCGECGRTVTNGEYSYGESTCCKAGVVPEEQYGQPVEASAKNAQADDMCEACGKNVANRECAHGILCDTCDEQVHGSVGGKCKIGTEEPPAPAAPTKSVVVIAGEQWVRYQKQRTKQPMDFYITAVVFKEDRKTVKSFNYSPDKAKAQQFGKLTAEDIAKQVSSPAFRAKARVEKA